MRKRTVTALLASVAVLTFGMACSDVGVREATPAATTPAGPLQVTELVHATAADGLNFEVWITGEVFDHDGDGDLQDEIEVLAPESVQIVGYFPSMDRNLLMITCYLPDCRSPGRIATFRVRYWSETLLGSREEEA